MRSQEPFRPTAQAGQGGSIARASHPSTGSITPATVERSTLDIADDFVAGDEGKADDVLEITRASPVQGSQVGTADTSEPGRRRTRKVQESRWDRARLARGPDADSFA